MNSFANSFNPNAGIPGTMKRRIANASQGSVVTGVTTPEMAQKVVAGLSADQVFDLSAHGDGVRRTAIQSWWVDSQLKVRLLPESTSNRDRLLRRSAEVLAEIVKNEDDVKGGAK